jgi:hypothetical protein
MACLFNMYPECLIMWLRALKSGHSLLKVRLTADTELLLPYSAGQINYPTAQIQERKQYSPLDGEVACK